jgi:L-fuculose-phosphate aldolase
MPPREKTEARIRRNLVAVCRRLAALELIGASEGNLSARLGRGRILATPSGSNKAMLEPDELVVLTEEGRKIRGAGRASSEMALHLAIYQARPEVEAVVHAHPLTAIALTLAGVSLAEPLVPEAVTTLGGGIPTAPYATPSTRELADAVVRAMGVRAACLMERHGAVAVGRDLFEACDRMETVERLAQIYWRARLLGSEPRPLPRAEVERLLPSSSDQTST